MINTTMTTKRTSTEAGFHTPRDPFQILVMNED